MLKIISILVCMYAALFGSTKSASFDCNYMQNSMDMILNPPKEYYCEVHNFVNITTPEEAQIDSIDIITFGNTHTSFDFDKVKTFTIYKNGQVHYFPRGLNEYFKNLDEIEIHVAGLKKIHQSDLKVFPNLKRLYLLDNNLEILEKNLFEFNPNLEEIGFGSNNISHIDPNVFDKLTKLKTLYLRFNTCINMDAVDNPTEFQNVIKAAKSQCTSSDYSKLEQKVQNLEAESQNFNLENLKEKLENLENEVKNSKYLNFFQDRLQVLKSGQRKSKEHLQIYSFF